MNVSYWVHTAVRKQKASSETLCYNLLGANLFKCDRCNFRAGPLTECSSIDRKLKIVFPVVYGCKDQSKGLQTLEQLHPKMLQMALEQTARATCTIMRRDSARSKGLGSFQEITFTCKNKKLRRSRGHFSVPAVQSDFIARNY